MKSRRFVALLVLAACACGKSPKPAARSSAPDEGAKVVAGAISASIDPAKAAEAAASAEAAARLGNQVGAEQQSAMDQMDQAK